jgi:hypothetical protein
MSLLNPFYKLKNPTFSPRTILHSFLNAHNTKQYFSKGISEQILFLMSFLNPFYKLKFPAFSPATILYSFLNATTSSNTFQRHFRTSSFLNVPPKPILQVEVPILLTHNFTLQLFESHNTKQYFSKDISEQVLFLISHLNPFYKLKYPSFSPTNIFYSFLNTTTPSNSFKKTFQTKFFS